MTLALVMALVGIGVLHLKGRNFAIEMAAMILFAAALLVALVDQAGW